MGSDFQEEAVLRRVAIVVCLLSAVSIAACKKSDAVPQAEIRVAIENYLKTRPGLAWDQMTMEITQEQISGDTAEADVTFKTKGGEGTMGFHYSLRREAGKWTVTGGRGGGMGMPGGHPPGAPPGTSGASPGAPPTQPATPSPPRSH